jgi:histone-lysine N-methyltransferase SETMAR
MKNRRGKLAKDVLFLQDNAPSQKSFIALQKLDEIGFELTEHPPYSSNLAPSDYYLFPKFKKHLKGAKFSTNNEVTCALENWFALQTKITIFFKGFRIT